jgi:hypothetical protein
MTRYKKITITTFLSILLLTALPVKEAHPALPIIEIIRQGVIKVIKAIDLMIQRLQTETIWLQNAQKMLENKLSQFKLGEIADWTENQRQLYTKYYDELWKVRQTIATYHRVSRIIDRQKQIIEQYKFTWAMVNRDSHFTKPEINYMYRVYTGIINESVNNLEQVLLVINAYKTQMSDSRRLELINIAADNIEKNYNDLTRFNQQNIQLSLNRARDEQEIQTVKKLYGINPD